MVDVLLAALVLVVVQQRGDQADEGQRDAEEAHEADEGLHVGAVHVHGDEAHEPPARRAAARVEAEGAPVVEQRPSLLGEEALLGLDREGDLPALRGVDLREPHREGVFGVGAAWPVVGGLACQPAQAGARAGLPHDVPELALGVVAHVHAALGHLVVQGRRRRRRERLLRQPLALRVVRERPHDDRVELGAVLALQGDLLVPARVHECPDADAGRAREEAHPRQGVV
mmetsp:Transcript_91629/g.259377  ORF Transcript_91629/g.259377 Transcript_91629/m.259377 type:complete len:228 (+) Transcript_91629:435-1118(+)